MSRRRQGEAWAGVECAVCGRECTTAAGAYTFAWRWAEEPKNDTIECARGHGCRRRPKQDEKREGSRWLFRFDGLWYSVAQLADLGEIGRERLRQRLNSGWTVEDALSPSIACPLPRAQAEARSVRAVILAGGVGDDRARAAIAREARPEWARGSGRVSKYATMHERSTLTLAAVATVCGLAVETVRALARKLGGLEAVILHKSEQIKAQRERGNVRRSVVRRRARGRPPTLSAPVSALAKSLGASRQGLWKAARRNGRTTAEEIAARLADSANDSREVAA